MGAFMLPFIIGKHNSLQLETDFIHESLLGISEKYNGLEGEKI